MIASSRAVQPRLLTWFYVDVGLDDAAYVVDVSALAGGDDRNAAEAVDDGEVRASWEERFEHGNAAGHAGD